MCGVGWGVLVLWMCFVSVLAVLLILPPLGFGRNILGMRSNVFKVVVIFAGSSFLYAARNANQSGLVYAMNAGVALCGTKSQVFSKLQMFMMCGGRRGDWEGVGGLGNVREGSVIEDEDEEDEEDEVWIRGGVVGRGLMVSEGESVGEI